MKDGLQLVRELRERFPEFDSKLDKEKLVVALNEAYMQK